jgi:hypothetical protein
MRVLHLSLTDFKGVEIELPWRRLNVLFGPNDAGKTNVLEAVAATFGAAGLTRGRSDKPALPKASAWLELEQGDDDDAVLASLFEWSDVPPLFPALTRHDSVPGGDGLSAEPAPARLKWAGQGPRGGSFALRRVNEVAEEDPDDSAGATARLQRVQRQLHERALRAMRARISDSETRADVDCLIRAAIQSRHLLHHRGAVSVLCPTKDECDEDAIAAAERLARAGWDTDSVVGPVVRQISSGSASREPFLRMLDRRALRPFDVVWAAAEGIKAEDVESALRREFDRWYEETARLAVVAREVSRLLKRADVPDLAESVTGILEATEIVKNTLREDRWLRRLPLEPVFPASWVGDLAERVSVDANRLAAPIVQANGHLSLTVLSPAYWIGRQRRLEPRMLQSHRDQPTPIRDLGYGVRTWAAVAAVEAATAQHQNALPALEAVRRLLARERHEPPWAPPQPILGAGIRKRLLIVDEPEQHLHPRAQEEIAAWLATGANERETLLATHALPFLNMPIPDAGYLLVTREKDGVTRGVDITDDIFSSLEQLGAEAGLSGRAEALQTLRLVCIVEGSHDEEVLRHFYGQSLARNRILVAPARGALNVNAIIDAPWLSRMGLPLVILFDDVGALRVRSESRPGRKEVAARAVWDMLDNWTGPGPAPEVASFELPDIYRALPEECMKRGVRDVGGSFPGWTAIDLAFAREPSTGFKNVLLQASGLAKDTDLNELLSKVLGTCRRKPHAVLEQAVQELLAVARSSYFPRK